VYLLDLDNTLHQAGTHILPEINRQMTQYLVEALSLSTMQANQLRNAYWTKYGSTLLGMIRHHNTNPHHFLAQTHRFSGLKNRTARHGSVPQRLKKLDGLRILLTNAPKAYAVEVCKTLNLYRHLHVILSIEDMVIGSRWRPKPATVLWGHLQSKLQTRRALLVDDTAGHLHQAARHGIHTTWITPPGLGFKRTPLYGKVRQRIHHFEQVRRVRF
jgi:putative hydrolase of the HAD superfamily